MSEAKGGRSWAATLAIALAVASVLLLLAAGPGVRSGIWHYRTGFTVMRIAAWAGIAAAVLGLIAAALGRGRPRALVLGTFTAAYAQFEEELGLQRREL